MISTTTKELGEAEETLRKVRAGILESVAGTLERGYEKCAVMRGMVWRSGLSIGLGSNHQAEKKEILRCIRHCETVIRFRSDGNLNRAFLFISALETMAKRFSGKPEFKGYAQKMSRAATDFKEKTVDALWPRELDAILTETERRLSIELQKMEESHQEVAA